jgi:hypothetical protein
MCICVTPMCVVFLCIIEWCPNVEGREEPTYCLWVLVWIKKDINETPLLILSPTGYGPSNQATRFLQDGKFNGREEHESYVQFNGSNFAVWKFSIFLKLKLEI